MGVRLRLGTLRSLLRSRLTETRYYHISRLDLGDEFTLVPKVPHDAVDLQEEDFTTPRICLAPTIRQALDALGLHKDERGKRDVPRFHVYETAPDVEITVPQTGDIPMDVYDLPTPERAAALNGRVPDAGSTGEVWSLRPVRVRKVKTVGDEA